MSDQLMNFLTLLLCFLNFISWAAPIEEHGKTGVVLNETGAYEGYTLIFPIGSRNTYLVDLKGTVVHTWKSAYPPGQSAYLLENGNLLRTASVGPGVNGVFDTGGAAGRVQEFTWDGELVWDFKYCSDTHCSHHDVEKLPNGNVLILAWELKSRDEAIKAGRKPENVGADGLWPDTIIEVKPAGRNSGQIVWQWHVWDHLVQEIDPEADNYDAVGDHPELININHADWMTQLPGKELDNLRSLGYLGNTPSHNADRRTNPDWNHTNSIAYNSELDQIAVSVLGFNEVWIIDHGTTTEQARGHKGGRRGKGGDLLYRFGNPQSYLGGTSDDRMLFAQHDAHWIPRGLKGAGHMLVFNNGRGRSDGDYSSIDELILPLDENGNYIADDMTYFRAVETAWRYTSPDKSGFYSGHISGAQRLPNGNTLICEGESGTVFEVTPAGKTVWKYVNPFRETGFPNQRPPSRPRNSHAGPPGGPRRGFPPGSPPPPPPRDRNGKRAGGPIRPPFNHGAPGAQLFRAYRYGPEYPGLRNRKLTTNKGEHQKES